MISPDASHHLIFIGGAPRSGTTLIQRVMGAHSEVYAGPEFDFTPVLADLRGRMVQNVRSGRISKLVDEQGLDRAFRAFMMSIVQAKLKTSKKKIFCEKTPANALHFTALAEIFPDAKFLFILRDPRAIVASMKEIGEKSRRLRELPPKFSRSVAASVREVNKTWSAGISAYEKCNRIKLVFYEDLILDPKKTVQEICNFTGLAFEDGMLEPEASNFESTENASLDNPWYTQEQLSSPILDTSLKKYRNSLTPREVSIIDNCIIKHPLTQRYQTHTKQLTVFDRICVWIGKARASKTVAKIELNLGFQKLT